VVNSLYYTFSTIAQALAGAIALLGAFVLFRLQSLNGEIERNASQISSVLELILDREEVRSLFHGGEYHELVRRLATVSIPPTTYQCTRERLMLPLLLERKEILLRRFKLAFYLTVGVIMVSVGLLTVAHELAVFTELTCVVFGIGLLLLAGCLGSYVSLMLEALK